VYFNPDGEYGRSLLDSPHKVVISPTINLPFGQGRKWLNNGGILATFFGGWTATTSTTLQSGFPMGVTQQVIAVGGNNFLFGGSVRPDLVPGVPILVPGDITDRIVNSTLPGGSPTDNLYLNPAAFTTSAATSLGNAPRILPGAYSPWRNNTDLSVAKTVGLPWNTHGTVRLEVLNLFNQTQWAALASSAFGASNFGQVTSQANNARMLQFTFRYQF
jgi:hypothetical protein